MNKVKTLNELLYNGLIYTLDEDNSVAEAVGFTDGKITFIGSSQDALKMDWDMTINLEGKMLLPGFVDSHMHMLHYAFVENSIKLFDCKSVEEVLMAVSKRFSDNPDNAPTWIFGRGWNEDNFDVSRYPVKDELDKISKEVPIIIVRVCGHTAVCNSCGLEKLKQISTYAEISQDVDENLGILKENAVQFFYSILDAPTENEIKEFIKFSISKLNEKGITGIQSDDLASLPGKNWRRIMASFKALDENNELNARIYEQCLFERFDDLKKFISEGYRTGQKGNCFTVGPVKLLQDGSLGAKTAALEEPYEGSSDNTGIIIYNQEELNSIIEYCDINHMQVAVHCIGDRAMNMVIEAITKSPYRSENPKSRHGIVHAQITSPGILEEMASNNILAYIQPVFVDMDMDIVEPRIGAHRMEKVYAWKSMLDMGIPTSGGSDAPVVGFDVLENIYFAVTRKNIYGEPKDGWIPSEKLSVDEAIRLFTKYAAYASYSENTNGTIELGKYADFVVLDRNLYEIPHDSIKDVNVEMTILNGNIVYQK